MREKLKQYIEQLFTRAPRTQSAQELKEEMLQNLLDKYDDLIRAGKSEEDAYAAAIAGIGDVGGLIDGLAPQASFSQTNGAPVAQPEPRQKNPVILAVAVALYVLCVVPNFIFGNVTGVVLMFVMIAAATAMILFNRTVVHPARSALVGVGVALLILCPTPTMMIGGWLGVTLLFVLIAAGVGLIVYGRTAQFDIAPEAQAGEAAPKGNALRYGYAAVAAVAVLLIVGAAVSDARRHTQVEWHGMTGEVIGGADGTTDIVVGEDFGARIEDEIDEQIDDNLGDHIESAVEGSFARPDDHDDDHDDHDDDDDGDRKKEKKNADAVTAAIMQGAAEVPAANINEIEIDWVGGSVRVAPYSGDTIAISETSTKTLTDRQKLRYTVKGNKLSISYCEETLYVWDWLDIDRLSMPAKTLTVQLPAGPLPELEINGVSADVDVSGIACDELDVECVSGDITVTDVSGRKLNVQTTSGKASVSGADVMKLDLESTSGAIDVKESRADEVDVETVSASAAIALTVAPRELDIETVSGGSTLTLPKDATDFSVRVETVSGDFSCGFAAVQQKGVCVVGSGAYQYAFTSVSGDLKIIAG